MSKLWQLQKCLILMTTRQNSRLSPLRDLSISITFLLLRTSTCSYTRMDRRNLINVHYISNSTQTLSGLHVGCFNAQSVQRNCDKRTEISNYMCDQHMDILFITKTRLKPHGDEGRLHDLTPAGYVAKSLQRESRGCGIQVSIKTDINNCYVLFSPPVIRSDTTVNNADFLKHQIFLFI